MVLEGLCSLVLNPLCALILKTCVRWYSSCVICYLRYCVFWYSKFCTYVFWYLRCQKPSVAPFVASYSNNKANSFILYSNKSIGDVIKFCYVILYSSKSIGHVLRLNLAWQKFPFTTQFLSLPIVCENVNMLVVSSLLIKK